jgi:t-SNARE complex subunit (syntaxin)
MDAQQRAVRRARTDASAEALSHLQPAAAEISALLGQLAGEVASQHDAVASIEASAVASRENVRKANRELRQATERPSAMRDLALVVIAFLAAALLFLEWYTP